MNLNGYDVIWCDTIKYQGVHLQSDRCVKFNSIFLHSHGVHDIALLHLQESYRISFIMYAIPALSLTNKQVNELNIIMYVVCLVITNGKVSVPCYCHLKDLMLDI